jgi:hypothetical protein
VKCNLPNEFSKVLAVMFVIVSISGCDVLSQLSPHRALSTPSSRRLFLDIHVYSANVGSVSQYYDINNDKIMKDDVWVFFSDGTYKANIAMDGNRLNLSGQYGIFYKDNTYVDDVIFIDIDNDDNYDEKIYLDRHASSIEWQRNESVFIYFLLK